jgi:hypothetical protein
MSSSGEIFLPASESDVGRPTLLTYFFHLSAPFFTGSLITPSGLRPFNARYVLFKELYRINPDAITSDHGEIETSTRARSSPFHTASQDYLIDTIFQRC